MASLARIGFFDTEFHPMLKEGIRPTFGAFLNELLKNRTSESKVDSGHASKEKEMAARLVTLGYCKENATAEKTAKTIR